MSSFLLVVACCYANAAAQLLPDLSLDVISFTPAGKSSLRGRDGITITFNRAVIALGSDFGTEDLPASLIPFHITMTQSSRKPLKMFPGTCSHLRSSAAIFLID